MLRVLGSPKRLCDGVTRREMLLASGLGLLGAVSRAETKHPTGFGKAKSCILLFLYGSPSQLETFDMKPDAPYEVRGDFKPIRSRLPGADVCELLPNLARVMDKVTVVRSLTHPYPIHGVAFATTGTPTIDIPMELNPHDGRHWPFIGSVVDYLHRRRGSKRPVPDNIALPFQFSSRRVGEVARAGPYAAFLGGAYNPVWTEFVGRATKKMTKTLQEQTLDVDEPYMGVTPESRFELATATDLPAGVTLDRLDRRRSLLEQFDAARKRLEYGDAGAAHESYRRMAHDLIGSDKIRTALDIAREPRHVRESYGLTVFGQGCLAARRLVEAGSRFVTVFWDEYGLAGSGWDTHWDHYNRMRKELLPGFDLAAFGLLNDLDQRGLLDETLVMVLSEHGRTPKLSSSKGGGRDHWSRCYSALLAGGGIARGRIVGKSDKIAGDVAERPISPKDVLATAYHLLGFDPETLLTDRTGRPLPLVPGSVVPDLLA